MNLKDHSYRDVAKTPIEDFESATTTPSWLGRPNQIWMCGASDNGEENPDSESGREEETYVPEPFPDIKNLSHMDGPTS